jgi:Glycosyltransferases involved in cell wall biogenesis
MTIIGPLAIAEPPNLDQVFVIIPALNEEAAIAHVIQDLQSQGLTKIRVVDNGSTDRTSEKAKASGGEVVQEPVAVMVAPAGGDYSTFRLGWNGFCSVMGMAVTTSASFPSFLPDAASLI